MSMIERLTHLFKDHPPKHQNYDSDTVMAEVRKRNAFFDTLIPQKNPAGYIDQICEDQNTALQYWRDFLDCLWGLHLDGYSDGEIGQLFTGLFSEPVKPPKVKLKSFYLSTSKVLSELSREGLQDCGGIRLSSADKRESVVGIDAPSYRHDGSLISPFDLSVLYALYSIHVNGNQNFYLSSLAKQLTGTKNISPALYAEIRGAIDRLRTTFVSFDLSEANFDFETDKGEKVLQYRNVLLTLDEFLVRLPNGEKTNVYSFIGIDRSPIPYILAIADGGFSGSRYRKQISTYADNVINVPSLTNNQRTITLRFLLLRHIGIVRKMKNGNRVLTLETLSKNVGVDLETMTRQEVQRWRKEISKCLDHFVSEAVLSSWQWVKEGQKIRAFRFDPPAEK